MKKPANAPSADAVVVFSGGQDSTLCLKLAADKFGSGRVAAMTFAYGQRHAAETRCARAIVRRFGIALHKVVKLDFYKDITTNALLDESIEIGRKKGSSCPTTVVEGRNAFFLLAAGVWAKSLGAKDIYTGVSQADFSGYPDCREKFIRAQQKAMRLAMEWPFRIVTPFMDKTKADEWELADSLGIMDLVRRETTTCYRGVPGDGCGRCPACRLRARGLAEYMRKKSRKNGRPAK